MCPAPVDGRVEHVGAAGTELPRSWWVRGLTPHERRPDGAEHAPSGPAAPPRWAEFVEHVVRHAPAQPVDGGPPAAGVAALTGALTPFVDVTTGRLAEDARQCRDVDQAAVCAGFAKQLGGMLVQLGARTLVTELATAARSGRLAGATPADRFADFVGRTGTRCGLVALCTGYPVLARLLGQACLHTLDAHRETLRRFAGDRAHIVASLYEGADPGPLTGIDVGQGDHHQAGRSVAILRFAAAGPVVYKPRSLSLQAHFDGIAAWLNTHVPDLDLRGARCLPMAGYGWQEFVAHLPCADAAGVERFYRRQGALLALLYALDGTDIHFDNLIANGDQPVLVDVETLFHPALAPVAAGATDPAWQRLTSSVARTALLPTVLLGERGALDVSGLGGDRDRTLPTDTVDWLDAGTDRMRLVRRPGTFAGGANRPRIGTTDADPRQYADALICGFRAGYEAITAHRQELVDLVRGCADDTIRILARSTQDYVTLLDESTHPDVLRDATDRDTLLFDTLSATAPNQLAAKLAGAESVDLWQGDVPVFFATAGRTDLRLSTSEHVDALDYAGMDMVVGKIGLMSEVDRGEQEWVIRAALATRAGRPGHAAGAALPASVAAVLPDRERLLSSACGVADEIVACAHRADSRANWLGMEQVDGRYWTVLSMGAGLADGYCGVALFLAQLGAVTGIARYGELARKAVAPIPLLLAMLAERPEQLAAIGPGGFGGLGGIAYALARMATLLGDAELLTWLATVVPMVGTADMDDETDNSVGTGRAGGVAALLAVHAETGLPDARRHADALAGRMTDAGLAETGFLYGRDGMRWAAARAGTADPGWCREPLTDPDLSNVTWCSGVAGVLLARAAQDPEVVRGCAGLLAGRAPLWDMALCHGELGVLEALTVFANQTDSAVRAREHGAAVLLGALDQFGPRCTTPDNVPTPGLLNGLAGIGYGLLRLALPAHVPSVLLLEPSTVRGTTR